MTDAKLLNLSAMEDLQEVTAFHRPLWERIRPFVNSKDLDRSLYLLVMQGYGATEIASWFGVSRERARQWIKRAGAPATTGTRPRVWDEKLARFRPVANPERYRQHAAKIRRDIRSQERKAERRRMVDIIQSLAKELGRSPTYREVAERHWPDRNVRGALACHYIGRLWGWPGSQSKRKVTPYAKRAWRAAGVPPRDQHSPKAGMGVGKRGPRPKRFPHEAVRAMWDAGMSTQQIAEISGYTARSIWNMRLYYGWQRRRPSRNNHLARTGGNA